MNVVCNSLACRDEHQMEWEETLRERETQRREAEKARIELETRQRIEARIRARQEAELKAKREQEEKGVCHFLCVRVCAYLCMQASTPVLSRCLLQLPDIILPPLPGTLSATSCMWRTPLAPSPSPS